MKYQINKSNYRDFSKFQENRLPHRSYFISFNEQNAMNKTDYLTERYESDAVHMLSGEWDFAYYKSAINLKSSIDTNKINFDRVNVPSTWQKTGYDKINYLNSMYPFACRPPKTPKNCPVGLYRKKFNLNKKEDFTYIITFLGVASSLDVYLNGLYIGYGEGSHNSSEFDLTNALKNGDNELVAVVYKWSTGTYLECQDMFRENGIFRDVYITELPKSYIFDFEFNSEKIKNGYNATIITKVEGEKKAKIKAQLVIGNECIAASTFNCDEKVVWNDLSVAEWSAELPVCYDLLLTLIYDNQEIQFIRQKVGFRTIKLDGYKYLWNEEAIKLKGVNHHDSHPIYGYAMTCEDLKKDIELMKEYNVNCMRTSHYPKDPNMLTMCDVYGIYVVDEADIETHGCYVRNINLISNDPKWKSHYLDRTGALFERDKNHTCVAMWSMGNEAGGISNFDACYEYLKEKTSIPVHYEPACRSERVRYDILAQFYISPADMQSLSRGEWKNEKNYDAPFFLCEYGHSMGVGPGGLDEYWDTIYSDDRFLGGCIWEWADHSHYDENAKYKYTYGGDHKDTRNSGNFCCDGLFYPDRTPSTSALCMKNVYSPLRASYENGILTIKNMNYFVSSKGISVYCYILNNGIKKDVYCSDEAIEPQSNKKVDIDIELAKGSDAFLIIEYKNVADDKIIATEQKIINESFPPLPVSRSNISWNVTEKQAKERKSYGKITFDKNGTLSSLTDSYKNEILSNDKTGFVPMLYQAVIDNHTYTVKALKKAGIDKLHISKKTCKFDSFLNTITSTSTLSAKGKKRFVADIVQKVISENEFYVTFSLESFEKKPLDMLQIGLTLSINGRYSRVRYYGMGENESYSDFSNQDVMGIYSTKASHMYVQNIKPQEAGNRNMVRWAEITDENNNGIRITALEQALNFKAVNVDEDNLRKSKHIEDVVLQDETVVHINGFMRGIGSQSCGPDTTEKHKKILHLSEKYSYSFKVEII